MTLGESWGRYPKAAQSIKTLQWRTSVLADYLDGRPVLAYGRGRSYGDCCLNDGGILLETSRLNHMISFDRENGVFCCEAGMSLAEVLEIVGPAGFFLPVSPGTKFVTIGGAIANDIHGKNHHRAGTFGRHVLKFEILRSDGTRFICSPGENSNLFFATIGGLGLTGLIVWAEFRLKKVESMWMDVEHIRFGSLEEFFEISGASDREFEYTVAWIDSLSSGRNFGRGVYLRGNHAAASSAEPPPKAKKSVSVPFDLPDFLLNRHVMGMFNSGYYAAQRGKAERRRSDWSGFFYPLDSVGSWNRIYGRRGFFQFQCVLPPDAAPKTSAELLRMVADSGRGSFLTVIKIFGGLKSGGLLSFPKEGVTLALDFPNRGASTIEFLRQLDRFVMKNGGRVYPAKDAVMTPESFDAYYPDRRRLAGLRDPAFSSSLWRRVTREK